MDVKDRHLSANDLAAAVEGRLDPDGRLHLKACRHCLAAFAEAAEVGAEWIDSEDRAGVVAKPWPARRRLRWALPAGLAAAALAAWGVLELPSSRRAAFHPSSTLVAAAEQYEATGYRLPRTEGGAPSLLSRGADPSDASRILAAADSMTTLWISAPSVDIALWRTVGLLTAGQERAARVSLIEALERYPQNADLLILRGALAYRAGDLDAARRALDEALQVDPGSEIARENLARLGEPSP